MSTIKKVAEHANVSVATVSRVINKNGYVSIELQERVHEAMRALNYQPSALARSLRRQETQTVGILIPRLDNQFFSKLAYSIEKQLFENRYHSFICSAEESAEKENAYIEMLLSQRVDGVIITPISQSLTNVQRLIAREIPVVVVDRDLVGIRDVNRVLCDNWSGAYDAARHLLDLGHRMIGVVGGPSYSDSIQERIGGAREAFAQYNVKIYIEEFLDTSFDSFDMSCKVARELLSLQPRPTAIFALTDMMALAVMHEARLMNIKIPQELSVVGFDNIPATTFAIPPLTTVAQPIYQMGERAAQILLRHMRRSNAQVESVRLETTLMIRESTARL